MHEILVKIGDNCNVDPEKGRACYKDGDIIHITTPSESKRIWNEMLEGKKCTKDEYELAQLKPGIFKWPWGKEELMVHHVLVTNDTLTDNEIKEILSVEIEDLTTDIKHPIYKTKIRRNFF